MNVLDPIARTIVAALGMGILEALALALAVRIFARPARTTATTRHVLWWLVLCATVLLPCATVAVSLGRIEHHAASTAGVGATLPAYHPVSSGERSRGAARATQRIEPPSTIAVAPAPSNAAPAAADPNVLLLPLAGAAGAVRAAFEYPGVAFALVVIWLGVAAVRLALLGRGLAALVRIKRRAVPLDESIAKRLRRYRHSTRTSRSAALLVTADVDVPIAVGFGEPAILLPTSVVELEAIADVDQIVMHEHAHLDRYDDVTNLVQRILERIFWFNPVVAFAGRRIALEREIACDDTVIAHTGRAHRYASCLWKLVEATRLPTQPVFAPGALNGPKQITQRIEQLLDSKRNALPRLSPPAAFALGALVATAIFVQAQHAPVIAIADASPNPSASPTAALAQRTAAAAPAPHTSPQPVVAATPEIDVKTKKVEHVAMAPEAPPARTAHAAPRRGNDADAMEGPNVDTSDARTEEPEATEPPEPAEPTEPPEPAEPAEAPQASAAPPPPQPQRAPLPPLPPLPPSPAVLAALDGQAGLDEAQADALGQSHLIDDLTCAQLRAAIQAARDAMRKNAYDVRDTAQIEAEVRRDLERVQGELQRHENRAQIDAQREAERALRRAVADAQRSAPKQAAISADAGAALGMDIAERVSKSVSSSVDWPVVERALANAKHDVDADLHDSNWYGEARGGVHRSLHAFHRIVSDGSLDVIVRAGSAYSVDFQGQNDAAAHTETSVSSGSLEIENDGGNWSRESLRPIIVTAPSIDTVTIEGSANVEVDNASGPHLKIILDGSGDARIAGTADAADVAIEGSGDVDALGLHANAIHIVNDGSGNVKINAPDTLDVHIEGSGDVAIRGNVKHLSSHIDGSGSIQHL